ncbi:MAG: UbiA family prenyltransferase [Crenarchaeota archaeon]|nr:UbiA family prenyltransferase [Thermoproteota archaeon]
MDIRAWLQLFRAQSAPATVLSILLPYLLGGGRDPLVIIAIIVIGTLLHWFSFGHNSLMDYWYDREDPNKKHHPLEAGTIRFEHAHQVIHYGMVAVTIALIILTLFVSPAKYLALAFLILYCVWGHAYNDGLDKNTSHSWISISACFTSLALYGWFLATDTINIITILIALWAFLTIFYQIAWEGNLKDLWNPAEKHNLLRRIGVKLKLAEETKINDKIVYLVWRLEIPKWFERLMYVIRLYVNTIIVAILSVLYGFSLTSTNNVSFLIVFLFMTALKTYAIWGLHNTVKKPFRRKDLLEWFGKAEAFEFYHFATLLFLLGLGWLCLLLLIYGIGYFVLMNKLLWGSKFGPRV